MKGGMSNGGCAVILMTALLLAGAAGLIAQGDWVTTDATTMDVSVDDKLIFTTTDSAWSIAGQPRRNLPVQFGVHVQNGQAVLSEGTVYLTGGELTLLVVFKSGDNEWAVELPMVKKSVEEKEAD